MNKTKKLVLGEGEAIGHKHVLESKDGISYERTPSHIRVTLDGLSVLSHDEHDKMVFNRSTIRSYNQVELNPMDNTVHIVFD